VPAIPDVGCAVAPRISSGPGPSETRPIGRPTLEDKVLQRAIVMLLRPIYEQDFKPRLRLIGKWLNAGVLEGGVQ
jgi:hypothetical protein